MNGAENVNEMEILQFFNFQVSISDLCDTLHCVLQVTND